MLYAILCKHIVPYRMRSQGLREKERVYACVFSDLFKFVIGFLVRKLPGTNITL